MRARGGEWASLCGFRPAFTAMPRSSPRAPSAARGALCLVTLVAAWAAPGAHAQTARADSLVRSASIPDGHLTAPLWTLTLRPERHGGLVVVQPLGDSLDLAIPAGSAVTLRAGLRPRATSRALDGLQRLSIGVSHRRTPTDTVLTRPLALTTLDASVRLGFTSRWEPGVPVVFGELTALVALARGVGPDRLQTRSGWGLGLGYGVEAPLSRRVAVEAGFDVVLGSVVRAWDDGAEPPRGCGCPLPVAARVGVGLTVTSLARIAGH